MDDFLAKATSILDGAVRAAETGFSHDDWTILVRDGTLEFSNNTLIPLESLRLERGAHEAFRLRKKPNAVTVEACSESSRVALAQALNPQPRLTMSDVVLYELVSRPESLANHYHPGGVPRF